MACGGWAQPTCPQTRPRPPRPSAPGPGPCRVRLGGGDAATHLLTSLRPRPCRCCRARWWVSSCCCMWARRAGSASCRRCSCWPACATPTSCSSWASPSTPTSPSSGQGQWEGKGARAWGHHPCHHRKDGRARAWVAGARRGACDSSPPHHPRVPCRSLAGTPEPPPVRPAPLPRSEFAHRGSLFKMLRKGGNRPLEAKLARSVVLSVARGMAYLHRSVGGQGPGGPCRAQPSCLSSPPVCALVLRAWAGSCVRHLSPGSVPTHPLVFPRSRHPPLLHLDLKSPNILLDSKLQVRPAANYCPAKGWAAPGCAAHAAPSPAVLLALPAPEPDPAPHASEGQDRRLWSVAGSALLLHLWHRRRHPAVDGSGGEGRAGAQVGACMSVWWGHHGRLGWLGLVG